MSAFTKLYASRYAKSGIRMNNVLPGFIDSLPEKPGRTARIPMGRYGTVGEIAKTVGFLLSADAAYITGQNILVDGGLVAGLYARLPCRLPGRLVTERRSPIPPIRPRKVPPCPVSSSITCSGLTKTYPGGKKVLENIHLSFYPDAKIGVLGVNGSGKSTLLRIMAGLDKEFSGEGLVAEGARVGYLPQEPQLDPALDVRGNVMLGVADKQAILDRYNELAMNYSDETADEMTQPPGRDRGQGPVGSRQPGRPGDGRARLPAGRRRRDNLSGGERRRVALCQLLLEQPDLLLLDEPTNHLDAETVAWLEGHLRDYPGAILIVTHDRYFLDNVTGWILELDRGRGIPYEGNYSAWLEQKQKRLAQEGREDEARQRALDARAANGSPPRRRRARPSPRRASAPTRSSSRSQHEKAPTAAQIVIPVAERLGQNVIDFDDLTKGYGDRAADRRPHASSCRPAASSASSARTAPARRRCSA